LRVHFSRDFSLRSGLSAGHGDGAPVAMAGSTPVASSAGGDS
jgi:hypothetical protein